MESRGAGGRRRNPAFVDDFCRLAGAASDDGALCLGVMMVLSGWALLRIARRLTSFSLNQHPTRQPPHPADETAPLTVYVWTPIGAAKDPRRRYIVDRYIAAVDNGGNISTGHAPRRSRRMCISVTTRSTTSAIPFRISASCCMPANRTTSTDVSCPTCRARSPPGAPDKKIQFYRYNPAALRAFWLRYRQDATYNLTRRNCSTTVIGALDSALEGVLDKHLWRRFLLLVLDPNLWMLAVLRSRGESMTGRRDWCWTMRACCNRLPSANTNAGG